MVIKAILMLLRRSFDVHLDSLFWKHICLKNLNFHYWVSHEFVNAQTRTYSSLGSPDSGVESLFFLF